MVRSLLSSFVATAGMTMFSYLLSVKKKEKFLEPLILNQLIFPEHKKEKSHHIAGYFIHYIVGLLFTPVYIAINKGKKKPGILKNASTGALNGLAGIAVWHLVLKSHPNPPAIKLKQYYAQLLVAHIIFGILNGLFSGKPLNKHPQTPSALWQRFSFRFP